MRAFKKMIIKLILLFTTLITSLNVTAKEIEVFSVRCHFTNGIVTDFKTGVPSTSSSTMSDLVFDNIDVYKKTARLIGNIGAETITVTKGHDDDSVHLTEVTPSGNMNITTIFLKHPNKQSTELPVVHSRHLFIYSPIPSQYVGFCTKLQ